MTDRPGFYGYRRSDGRVGTRNHVLVVPTVICSSRRRRARRRGGAADRRRAAAPRRLRPARPRHARHPRHARGVLRPSERRRGARRRARLRAGGRADARRCRAACTASRSTSSPSSRRAAPSARPSSGSAIARELAPALAAQPREWCDVSELVLSLKCGGSDYTSGLASNPALGRVADRLVDLGGSAVLGEIAEIMGAEHLLAARAPHADTAAQLHPDHHSRRGRGAWRSASTSAARSRRPATSAAA